MKQEDFQKAVLEDLRIIKNRLNRLEVKTAALAATVAILVHFIF